MKRETPKDLNGKDLADEIPTVTVADNADMRRSMVLSNSGTKIPTQGWTGPIEDTPGPAAYTAKVTETGKEHDMQVMDSGEKMKSASFASTMQRPGVVLRNAFTPGAGSASRGGAPLRNVLIYLQPLLWGG